MYSNYHTTCFQVPWSGMSAKDFVEEHLDDYTVDKVRYLIEVCIKIEEGK